MHAIITADAPHVCAPRGARRWACALNDFGWRCGADLMLSLKTAAAIRQLRAARKCIVEARPGTRGTGDQSCQ